MPSATWPPPAELLDYLEEEHIVRHVDGRYHWMAEDFPASEFSLRSAASENFVIIDITDPDPSPRHRRNGPLYGTYAAA